MARPREAAAAVAAIVEAITTHALSPKDAEQIPSVVKANPLGTASVVLQGAYRASPLDVPDRYVGLTRGDVATVVAKGHALYPSWAREQRIIVE